MPYTHTTYSELKTSLASRLGDPSSIFWPRAELGVYLSEAFRTFGVLSGFWRERGVFATVASTAFYDITTQLSSLLAPTVTDRDIIKSIQYALLEPTTNQSLWNGTSQFTYTDVSDAVINRRNQFLSDTGIVLTRSTQAVASPPTGRQSLTDTIIDVRRASWVGASPFGYYTTLWRSDEFELTAANHTWASNPSTPTAFSIMSPPPLQLQLAPHPSDSGTLDMVTINATPALDPATTATVLGIPDDLTPAIKWGALADLLGIDGEARDSERAAFCERRYQQLVQLARLLSCVINAEINGVGVILDSLASLDAAVPDWQNHRGTPSHLAIAGWNLLATYPIADSSGPYSVTLDVVRNAVLPANDGANIQLGREQIDMILDYAEHIALFKVGGYEFASTSRQADNFLLQSITYNQRLSAAAKYIITPKRTARRNDDWNQRRAQADSLGALPSIEEAQSFVAGNAPARMTTPRRGGN